MQDIPVNVDLQDLIEVSMAKVIITFKIMPEGVDINLEDLKSQIIKRITNFGGIITEEKKEPVAYGLNSLNITFNLDEDKGDTERLEEDICKIEGIQSCSVISVSRAMG